MAHKINASKCVGCGCCEDACPAEAISPGTPYKISADKCVDCGACAAQCPVEAIDCVGDELSSTYDAYNFSANKAQNDIADSVARDRPVARDRKVAIVGVEGSGKTVMLAGLGALYSQPDQQGYFLSPKTFETTSYVNRQMSILQSGHWPSATAEDVMQGLDWDLRQNTGNGRPKKICELSFLDFAGEVYRAAFVRKTGPNDTLAEEVARLKQYLREADEVVVLVNLSDVIKFGAFSPRVEESVWITNAILDFVIPDDPDPARKMPRAAIVLSQADNYRDTIAECGGPSGALKKYLPHVANNYGWLDTFAACTVDKTDLDDDGHPVPSPDFTTKGLAPIMEWVLKS